MPRRSERSLLREHVQVLEQELECPICVERDKELRLFPECQHFACTDCVGEHFDIHICWHICQFCHLVNLYFTTKRLEHLHPGYIPDSNLKTMLLYCQTVFDSTY